MYYKKLENNEKPQSPILTKMTPLGADNFIIVNDDGSELGFEPPTDWKPSEVREKGKTTSPFKLKAKKPTKAKKPLKVTKTRKPATKTKK
ncbi:MAG: hypothetical protein GY861_06650 [bacterium]|nr:hypothetical protein [bacterium]